MKRKSLFIILLVLLLAITVRAAFADVFINEFLADPSTPEPANEWIELYYNGTSSINLTNWYFRDAGSRGGMTMPVERKRWPGAGRLVPPVERINSPIPPPGRSPRG